MHLNKEEVKRFFSVWFSLLYYVNTKRKVVRSFPAVWTENAGVKPETAARIRDVLWANDDLRLSFIAENPAHLSSADLALVESWQHRIAGQFIILRYLKKYAVFTSDEQPSHAYGVLGISDSFETMTGGEPLIVETVLLPFEGRIIYDGLVSVIPVVIGPGMLEDLYYGLERMEEREGIITKLPPAFKSASPAQQRKSVQASNKKVLAAFKKHMEYDGLSPKMTREHLVNIEAFAQTYLSQQDPPRALLDMSAGDLKSFRGIHSGAVNLVSFKRFIQFLEFSGRADWDTASELLDYLKQARKSD